MNAAEADIVQIGRVAERKFGLRVSENPHFGGVNPVHVADSYHYRALAIDVAGDPKKMLAFDRYVARRWGPHLAELFHEPGVNLKNGQPTSPIGGHADHVHVALDPSMVKGKGLAGLIGLRLNPGTKTDYGGGPVGFAKEFVFGDPLEALDIGSGQDLKSKVRGGAADAVDPTANLAGQIVSDILGQIHAESLMLNIALVGGGAFLVYYGAALMLGVKKPVGTPAKAAAIAAAMPK
ncbi:MAG TPA: hypothetical protein VFG58_02865 [Solirubrobacterales bacterium]|nr:hypothetical protein [Solirubrobacterales bacterium]